MPTVLLGWETLLVLPGLRAAGRAVLILPSFSGESKRKADSSQGFRRSQEIEPCKSGSSLVVNTRQEQFWEPEARGSEVQGGYHTGPLTSLCNRWTATCPCPEPWFPSAHLLRQVKAHGSVLGVFPTLASEPGPPCGRGDPEAQDGVRVGKPSLAPGVFLERPLVMSSSSLAVSSAKHRVTPRRSGNLLNMFSSFLPAFSVTTIPLE